MTKKTFEPGHGYTVEDWDAVDSPPATPEQLAQAKPFAAAFPDLADAMRRNVGGRPPLERTKKAISVRLDQDVIDKFRSTGKGWQTRMNDALRRHKI